MTEPAKRLPKWLRLDIAILVVGAIIMIATTLWSAPNKDSVVQRMAHGAQSTGGQLLGYVTERRKPVVP